jgi:hypothetical protein
MGGRSHHAPLRWRRRRSGEHAVADGLGREEEGPSRGDALQVPRDGEAREWGDSFSNNFQSELAAGSGRKGRTWQVGERPGAGRKKGGQNKLTKAQLERAEKIAHEIGEERLAAASDPVRARQGREGAWLRQAARGARARIDCLKASAQFYAPKLLGAVVKTPGRTSKPVGADPRAWSKDKSRGLPAEASKRARSRSLMRVAAAGRGRQSLPRPDVAAAESVLHQGRRTAGSSSSTELGAGGFPARCGT